MTNHPVAFINSVPLLSRIVKEEVVLFVIEKLFWLPPRASIITGTAKYVEVDILVGNVITAWWVLVVAPARCPHCILSPEEN